MNTNCNITNPRVAELSATLKPIDSFGIDMITSEMCGTAEDYCCYNQLYFDGKWQPSIYDDIFQGCLLQSVEDFQVVRKFHVQVHMECPPYDKIPENWEDVDAPDFPELEYVGCEEVEQIWIDSKANVDVIKLTKPLNYSIPSSHIVHIDSLQGFCTEPNKRDIIVEEVAEETDYSYDFYDGISLEWRLSECREYLSIAEPDFLALVEDGTPIYDRCKNYKHVFKIAHRRGWRFPTCAETASLWLEHIAMLDRHGRNTHDPLLICPDLADLAEAHRKLIEETNARLAEERRRYEEQQAKARAERRKKEESDFRKNHAHLFGFDFHDEEFRYTSLDSVEAYEREGHIMHHCIYHCGWYHTNHDKLSMHIADLEGNRVATCTIIVSKGEVECIQPIGNDTGYYNEHGERWQSTRDYKRIWNTLNARMHIIQKQAKENKQKQRKQRNKKAA